MKLRRKICGILASMSGIMLLFSLIIPFFNAIESNGKSSGGYGLFNKSEGFDTRFKALNDLFEPAFAQMVSVICIISIILYGLFVLLFFFQVVKFGAVAYRPILRAISLVLIILGVCALASGLTFTIMNRVVFNGRVILSFRMGGGLYLLSGGALLTGIFGFIGEARY